MASIQFNTINSQYIDTDFISNFSATITYGPNEIGKRVYVEDNQYNFHTVVQLNEGSTSFKSFTIDQLQGPEVQIILTLIYQIKTITYQFWYSIDGEDWEPRQSTNPEILSQLYLYYAQFSNCELSPNINDAGDADVECYNGAWLATTTSYGNEQQVQAKKTFYLRPNKFYFLGDNTQSLSSYKERIKIYVNDKKKGLKSALPNIYRFNEVATQWKRWKNQSTVADCSAFQKGQNLSKEMMNKAAAYIGANIGDSTLGPLKLTKKMFAALENKLNE